MALKHRPCCGASRGRRDQADMLREPSRLAALGLNSISKRKPVTMPWWGSTGIAWCYDRLGERLMQSGSTSVSASILAVMSVFKEPGRKILSGPFYSRLNFSDAGMHGGGRALSDG